MSLSPTAPPARIAGLDGVRGLAVLAVTLFRFGMPLQDGTPGGDGVSWVFGKGERGVDLFFVLSGFLITGILYDAKGAGHYFRDFFVRRSLRIFPLYFGVLFAAFVLLPAVWPAVTDHTEPARSRQEWLWTYTTNVCLSLDGRWSLGSFNHFWSLAVEEHFYLLWPFVIAVLSRRAAMLFCAECVVLAAGCRVFLHAWGHLTVTPDVLTVCRMDALAVGGFLALAARGPGGVRALVPWAWRLAVPAGALLTASALAGRNFYFLPHTFAAVAFGGLIVWAAAGRSRLSQAVWGNRTLATLGKYSYAMYVFGNFIVPAAAAYWPPTLLSPSLGGVGGRLAHVALSAAATFVAAWVSWHLYEKHFLKLKDRLAPRAGTAEEVSRERTA